MDSNPKKSLIGININRETEHVGPVLGESISERTTQACPSSDPHIATHWGLSGYVGIRVEFGIGFGLWSGRFASSSHRYL